MTYALVPLEPTEEQLIAYRQALSRYIRSIPVEERDRRWIKKQYGFKIPEKEKAAVRYRAMILAAPASGDGVVAREPGSAATPVAADPSPATSDALVKSARLDEHPWDGVSLDGADPLGR